MRVLHGPVNIGNQAWSLSRAERRHGIVSDLVINQGNWLRYSADRILSRPGEPRLLQAVKRIAFGLTAPWRYDVFHFYFGKSFVSWEAPSPKFLGRAWMADLHLAKRFGRKVFMTLQGCDVRLAARSNAANIWTMCSPGHCPLYEKCLSHIDARRQRLIDEILPLCNAVFYVNPELGHFLSAGHFLPYASVEINRLQPEPLGTNARPRIIHAPTNAAIKGTSRILEALERLKSHFDFELILVEDKAHTDAMQIYRSGDLAIDQILAGWYGGFAVEMMAMGKPVAAFIRDEDMEFIPKSMRAEMPILRIRPESLVDDLAGILARRRDWPDVGRKSRQYVERWHSPDLIAIAMIAAYRDIESTFKVP